jgi:single-stranded-DNA-specific exonuclease
MPLAPAALAEPAYFGVERSLSGRRWRSRPADLGMIAELRRRERLPELCARILAARGVTQEGAEDFLRPTLRRLFPDPSSFRDMDIAAELLEDAIQSGRKAAVLADYDVDGGTSAALLVRYFRARGRTLQIYIPDRIQEGYGPSARAFERLAADGVELVVTVDCGAAAHAPLAAAAALGLDVVVLDHHLMGGAAPPAAAVVNPNHPECQSGQGALTAAGVTLVAIVGVNRAARRRGSPGSNALPDPVQWLDLAALGTVCDVAPLTGFNRALVTRGLQVLARNGNAGLAALAAAAGKPVCSAVQDLGFVLGPRLNAGGRIGDSSLAARLLSTEDATEAAQLAGELDRLNAERRSMERLIVAEALRQAEGRSEPVVLVGAPDWHPGVIGVAAGRLKEALLKPVIVLGGGGAAEAAKGSGRSVSGVNLGAAVAEAARQGLIPAGGGHAMAAGLSVEWSAVEALRGFLQEALGPSCAQAAAEARTLWVDAVVGVRAVDLALLASLEPIGPFGAGHPEPLFGLAQVRVSFAQRLKGGHVRAVLEDASGARLPAIAFRAEESPIGEALLARSGGLQAVVRLSLNSYRGVDQVQAEIVDLAL